MAAAFRPTCTTSKCAMHRSSAQGVLTAAVQPLIWASALTAPWASRSGSWSRLAKTLSTRDRVTRSSGWLSSSRWSR